MLDFGPGATELPPYIRVGDTREVLRALRKNPAVDLAIFERKQNGHAARHLGQLVVTSNFARASYEACQGGFRDQCILRELSNDRSSLAKIENQLGNLCPGLEILAADIYENQMGLYFQDYPEIAALDVETRIEEGRYPPTACHTDGIIYETYPFSIATAFGRSTQCLLIPDPAVYEQSIRHQELFERAYDSSELQAVGTGNIARIRGGHAPHRSPVRFDGEARILNVIYPSKSSLKKLGIPVP